MNQLSRIETRLAIRCPRDLVWKSFLDFNRWAPATGVFGPLQWNSGIPWTKGSKADLEILVPTKIKTQVCILSAEISRSLRWLFHGNGVTCNEGFDLYDSEPGTTQIHISCDFTGEQLVHFGKRTEDAVGELFWFTVREFRRACEAAISPTIFQSMHQAYDLTP